MPDRFGDEVEDDPTYPTTVEHNDGKPSKPANCVMGMGTATASYATTQTMWRLLCGVGDSSPKHSNNERTNTMPEPSTYPLPGNILIDAGELDALPWGAIIVDRSGAEWRHASFYCADRRLETGEMYWTDARKKNGPMFASETVSLPARLLYATGIYAPGPDDVEGVGRG